MFINFLDRKIIFFSTILFLTLSLSQIRASDDYGGANPGGSNNDERREIFNRDAAHLACEGSLCQIFSIEVDRRQFTISANLGNSQNGGGYNGGGYYGGGSYGGNNQNPNNNTIGRFNAGISVTWEDERCTKMVNVDRAVYESITEYMKMLVNHDGSTNPAFTPAEQTMIVFYTTIMQLLKGATCN